MKLPEGITERMLQYWQERGYVPGGKPGRGNWRKPVDERLLTTMVKLRKLGIEAPLAGRLATQISEGERRIKLAPGLHLVVLSEFTGEDPVAGVDSE